MKDEGRTKTAADLERAVEKAIKKGSPLVVRNIGTPVAMRAQARELPLLAADILGSTTPVRRAHPTMSPAALAGKDLRFPSELDSAAEGILYLDDLTAYSPAAIKLLASRLPGWDGFLLASAYDPVKDGACAAYEEKLAAYVDLLDADVFTIDSSCGRSGKQVNERRR